MDIPGSIDSQMIILAPIPIVEYQSNANQLFPFPAKINHNIDSISKFHSDWLSSGLLIPFLNSVNSLKSELIDIVYTWVNGTDPDHSNIRSKYWNNRTAANITAGTGTSTSTSTANADYRYRDHNELKYSIRSVYQYANELAGNIYIISSDCNINRIKQYNGKCGPGLGTGPQTQTQTQTQTETHRWQIPSWYNSSFIDTAHESRSIHIIYHSDLFSVGNNIASLPNFNSFAIESQLGFLSDTIINNNNNLISLSRHFIYLNDDMLFGNSLSSIEFYNPIYGMVFYLESHLIVKTTISINSNNDGGGGGDGGEWSALEYTNSILSARFGSRDRFYVSHYAHIFDRDILKEISSLWSAEIKSSSLGKFRGETNDIHMAFLFVHYVIEMSRESQLKSYLIYKIDDNHDGYWSADELQVLLDFINIWNSNDNWRQSTDDTFLRKTLEIDNSTAHPNSKYIWSSLDGFPNYHIKSHKYRCQSMILTCLPDKWKSQQTDNLIEIDIYILIRDRVECGDCLLDLLIYASGSIGIEALLPSTVNWRQRALDEISRYQFVIAQASALFLTLSEAVTVSYRSKDIKPGRRPGKLFELLDRNPNPPLFLSINEYSDYDLNDNDWNYFQDSMNSLYPNRIPFENIE